jgi:hypothetical protein
MAAATAIYPDEGISQVKANRKSHHPPRHPSGDTASSAKASATSATPKYVPYVVQFRVTTDPPSNGAPLQEGAEPLVPGKNVAPEQAGSTWVAYMSPAETKSWRVGCGPKSGIAANAAESENLSRAYSVSRTSEGTKSKSQEPYLRRPRKTCRPPYVGIDDHLCEIALPGVSLSQSIRKTLPHRGISGFTPRRTSARRE